LQIPFSNSVSAIEAKPGLRSGMHFLNTTQISTALHYTLSLYPNNLVTSPFKSAPRVCPTINFFASLKNYAASLL